MNRTVLVLLLGCAVAPAPPTPPRPNLGLQCGVIDTPCNCNGTVAVNWMVTPTTKCQSGRHMFYQCQAPCLGGAWESACYCDGRL